MKKITVNVPVQKYFTGKETSEFPKVKTFINTPDPFLLRWQQVLRRPKF